MGRSSFSESTSERRQDGWIGVRSPYRQDGLTCILPGTSPTDCTAWWIGVRWIGVNWWIGVTLWIGVRSSISPLASSFLRVRSPLRIEFPGAVYHVMSRGDRSPDPHGLPGLRRSGRLAQLHRAGDRPARPLRPRAPTTLCSRWSLGTTDPRLDPNEHST